MKIKKMFFVKLYLVAIISSLLVVAFASFSFASVEVFNKKSGLVSDLAYNIYIGEDTVWFASGRFGAAVYDKGSGQVTVYGKGSKIAAGAVGSVAVGFGKTWFGTEQGLNVMDEDGEVTTILEIEIPKLGKAGQMRKAMLYKAKNIWFADGALWVCSLGVNGGLYRYDGDKWEERRFGRSVFNYVSDLLVVGDDIWFTTGGFGVYIYNKVSGKWTVINTSSKNTALLVNDTIASLIAVGDDVWAATGDGVSKINKSESGKITVTHYSADDTKGIMLSPITTSIAATQEGDIYVGTVKGLIMLSDGTWSKVEISDESGKPYDIHRVFSLNSDGDTIWVGSNMGIIKLN